MDPAKSVRKRLRIFLTVRLIMSEIVGITDVEELEKEVALLEKKLELAKDAENTSLACERIIGSINSSQAKDGFLVTEGNGPNQFHTPAALGESGCCVLS